jgi:hypothetical protein
LIFMMDELMCEYWCVLMEKEKHEVFVLYHVHLNHCYSNRVRERRQFGVAILYDLDTQTITTDRIVAESALHQSNVQ